MNAISIVAFIFLGLSVFLGLIRLLKGPHSLDRLLSLDFLGLVGVNICIFITVLTNFDYLIDVALSLALVCFITALTYGQNISKQKEAK